MPENACPVCGALIDAGNVNIEEGVALCRACGKVSQLSDVVDGRPPTDDALAQTPSGCEIEDDGHEIRLTASARSLGTAAFAAAFSTIWNGVVSVFVAIAASGLYTHVIGPVPEWFPSFDDNDAMPLGMVIFLWIFLLPFICVGAFMLGLLLVSLFGTVRVQLQGSEAVASTGIGPLRWKRRFDASRVKTIRIGKTEWEQNNKKMPVVCIEADHTVKVGSMLRRDRREWLAAALKVLLVSHDDAARERLVRPRFTARSYRQ